MPSIQAAMSGSVVVVEYNNDTFHVTYDIERMTKRLITAVLDVQTSMQEGEIDIAAVKMEMARLLCQIVTAWDATDANGDRVPFDIEHVAPLALMFMYAIFNAIIDDFNAKNDDGATSKTPQPSSQGTRSRKGNTRRSSTK